VWQVDDKKASFYAFVPDNALNSWPSEMDLKTAYLSLGQLIFDTGKLLLNYLGLNETVGLSHEKIVGYGRMLHYHKESDATNDNPNWCGAHFDHSVFTGLMPAYYFRNGLEVEEPEEAGLYVVPSNGSQFEKVMTPQDILLFQVGEFGQLISNDNIMATKHVVRKAKGEIERYTFALFYSPDNNMMIKSHSKLTQDDRYRLHQCADGSITFGAWHQASFDRYRVVKV
jgi:isopenicillin N synthase-like dioxygenase